jgi:Polyketide cyclase / dehydrase and lipid transport
MKQRLTGSFSVQLPPGEAFHLFTPRGEREWVAGWQPRFPAPAEDDTAPGTVFQTEAHGQVTTWVVVEREAGRRIAYARVAGAANAGTVRVTLAGVAGHSEVTVTYELTALDEAGGTALDEFAAGYPEFLRSWQRAIEARLARA